MKNHRDTAYRPPAPKILVCKECGSDDVLLDAYARWNAKTQQYELAQVLDSGHFCNTCGQACKVKTVYT